MPVLDYHRARALLEEVFQLAEQDFQQGKPRRLNRKFTAAGETIFKSSTQAYREVLLGCTVARLLDRSINVRQPYVKQGPMAFSGRTLDERVINPFLRDKRIPSSAGPYLSVFRRSVQFDQAIRGGLRDQEGYSAFLVLLGYLESSTDERVLLDFLRYLLHKFAQLRESSMVPVSRLQRISLEQYERLLSGLLHAPSGGRLPVVLVVATFEAIREFFGLSWEIVWQGINVADAPSGAAGDITVRNDGQVVLAIEVTERPIDRARVVSTFTTKIAPAGIEDYLFFTRPSGARPEAKQQAQQYFAQGHEVNFVEIQGWILTTLATLGKRGRALFNRALLQLLDDPNMPSYVKMAWNDQIERLVSAP